MVGRWFFAALFVLALVSTVHAADPGMPASQRLATLAQNMLQFAGTNDYTLDCGPAKDVLISPPSTNAYPQGEQYCVMNMSGNLVIGTFGDSNGAIAADQLILNTYKYDLYKYHIDITKINTKACAGKGIGQFDECANALPTVGSLSSLHFYYLDDQGATDTGYLIVSQNPITNTNFLATVADFFKNLFGAGSSSVVETTDQFDYGYFARKTTLNVKAPLNVTATWYGGDATIVYRNFVTDFSKARPDQSKYSVGHGNKQILSFSNFAQDSPDNVQLWKQFTSGLRITSVAGTPVAGDVCGDGKVGFDEQCETGDTTDCSVVDPITYSKGYKATCFPASDAARGCTWDTSACVSCQDLDRDTFWGGQGITGGALTSLSSSFSLGTAMPYGMFTDATRDLETKRSQQLILSSTILPVTYDLAFPPSSTAATLFDVALAKHIPYSATDVDFGKARSAMMANLLKTIPARPCAPSGGKLLCPDGYSPNASGINVDYPTLLQELKLRSISPIIRITLGACSDQSCGPYGYQSDAVAPWKVTSGLPTRATYTDAEKKKITAYCAMVADGFGSYWKGLNPALTGSPTSANTFIVIGDPTTFGMSSTEYESVYQTCKNAIESVQGKSAVVLYATPPLKDTKLATYLLPVKSDGTTHDGVYIESAITGNNYEEITSMDSFAAAADSLRQANTIVYSRATLAPTELSLFGTQLPLEHVLSGMNLLYDTLDERNLSKITVDPITSAATEEVSSITKFWGAVIHSLQGTVYSFKTLPDGTALPSNVKMIVGQTAAKKSTLTIFNFNDAEKTVNIDLSKCSVSQYTKLTKTDEKITKTAPVTFDKKAPPYSITTIEFNDAVTCIVGTGAVAKCGGVVDCLDTNPGYPDGPITSATVVGKDGKPVDPKTVYPGATEICGQGIDSDCSGNPVDTPPYCTPPADVIPPATIVCNYDGVCDAGESANCWDCLQGQIYCPTTPVKVGSRGAYEWYVRANAQKQPELIFKFSSSLSIQRSGNWPYVTYGGQSCYLNDPNNPGSAAVSEALYDTTNTNNVVDWDTNQKTVDLTRKFPTTGGLWRLTVSTGSTRFAGCWAKTSTSNDGAGFTVDIPFSKATSCIIDTTHMCTDPVHPGLQVGSACATDDDCCANLYCAGATGSAVCRYSGSGGGGGGGIGCFIAGTPVRTRLGERTIETIALGDEVEAFDTVKNTKIYSPVTYVERKIVTALVVMGVRGLPDITTTAVHRFWTRRGWVAAGELKTTDELFDGKTWHSILSLTTKQVAPTTVYNLHIADDAHDFYAGGVLVHNMKQEYPIIY